jgi:sRNA-binding regulator protein Hfq
MKKVALQQAAAALNNVVKPKAIEEPDVAFMISARMMRAPVVFEFNDGTQLTGLVQSFGRHSISIVVAERSEIIWKHALKHMRPLSPTAPTAGHHSSWGPD